MIVASKKLTASFVDTWWNLPGTTYVDASLFNVTLETNVTASCEIIKPTQPDSTVPSTAVTDAELAIENHASDEPTNASAVTTSNISTGNIACFCNFEGVIFFYQPNPSAAEL